MIKIKTSNLSFAYGKETVLKNVSFEIEQMSTTVLLGLNGSGKTTLIKLLTALLPATEKQIYICGKDVSAYSTHDLSRLIAYVPQIISDDNDFLVRDYLTFGLMNSIKFYSSPRIKEFEKVEMIASEIGIETLLVKRMNELSGGQRQLVVIARAIVQDTEIILLDEPTSSLDYKNQHIILSSLEKLREKGKTIILSCHNPSVPMLLNSNVIVLDNGVLTLSGKARELLSINKLKKIYGDILLPCSELPYCEVSLRPMKV